MSVLHQHHEFKVTDPRDPMQNFDEFHKKTFGDSTTSSFPNQATSLLQQHFPEHSHHFNEFNQKMMEIHSLDPFSEEWRVKMNEIHNNIAPGCHGSLTNNHFDSQGNFYSVLNMGDFKPEEINIELKGNNLHINAQHKEDSQSNHISNCFTHEIYIPSTIDMNTLKTNLNSKGQLIIEACALQKKLN
ncbi:Alpha crystallin/Hsp20 domain and HSP20-like chaperone domain-containing protein [Strongyloides ratti]|uniref:Alpha crystallin/Hsp20 domain and HSP20-like chaperone domain-containing protein n=1 Tax=Strongyloides ratti TaxID=34506 RepID=A0A090L1T5_STRRB|nr:Alpha crystallin/Hsp20 domain and HSP20-like chaperone domain-containing protein [Strongyloides ratti]CEF63657.1 Alpha crystallin/Hsp20 domain and HSP20-like chaperone domain-containing protein [Strongyloides ratti]